MVVNRFKQVLDKAGYTAEPTEANVREMFADYVDCGFFSNVEADEIDEISTEDICKVFLKLR